MPKSTKLLFKEKEEGIIFFLKISSTRKAQGLFPPSLSPNPIGSHSPFMRTSTIPALGARLPMRDGGSFVFGPQG